MNFIRVLQILESKSQLKVKQIVTIDDKKYVIAKILPTAITVIPVDYNKNTKGYDLNITGQKDAVPLKSVNFKDEDFDYTIYSKYKTIGKNTSKYKKLITEAEFDVDKKILDMWASNADIEDIIKVTRKKVGYIKNLLKQNKRKGWEEL